MEVCPSRCPAVPVNKKEVKSILYPLCVCSFTVHTFINGKKSIWSWNKENLLKLSVCLYLLLSFSICYLKTELVSGDVFGQLSWIRGIELDLEVELPWPLDLLWDSLLRVQPSLIVVVVHITEAKVVLLQEVDAVSHTVDEVLALGFFLLRFEALLQCLCLANGQVTICIFILGAPNGI